MCAVRPVTGIGSLAHAISFWQNGVGGARLTKNGTPGMIQVVDEAGASGTETGATNLTLDAWQHLAGVFDDTANVATLYLNGVSDCSGGCATPASLGTSSLDFVAGSNTGISTGEWLGQLDECGVYSGVIGPESMCRVYCCGINGEGCERTGTSYDTFGRCTDATTPCTLPAADQAAPDTN